MDDIIYINFNGIKHVTFVDFITIKLTDSNDVILFENIYNINYYINSTDNQKIYYIKIESGIKNIINTENIYINLPDNHYFQYTYFKNQIEKSIVIYSKYNYLPLIYLGLPNNKYIKSFKIICNYIKIGSNINNYLDVSDNQSYCCIDCSDNYDGTLNQYVTLFNNCFGMNNHYNNTLKLPGDIYQICILNNSGITSYDQITNTTNYYELFKIKNNIDITNDTNIYFYDSFTNPHPLSYIINLNTYFSLTNVIFEKYPNIIFNINYIDVSGNICIDSSGNIYSNVLSLNLQTFNQDQLCINNDISENNYYNTLFFYNYYDDDTNINIINMFNYDYDKYFYNTRIPVELFNINSYQTNLYDKIILTDNNLLQPTILNIVDPYLFINLDVIQLQKTIINPELINKNFYDFTKSNKINFDIIARYLLNFTIKKYNIFKITNSNDQTSMNTIINFNNNIVNCIKCKVVFYYSSNNVIKGVYSFDAKLFLNNYNLELYHKEFDFVNINSDEQKRKLINMLIFLCSNVYQIKLYFYNNKNSVVPSLYLFNEVNLLKKNNDYNIQFDVLPLDNTYTSGYLQFNMHINKEYYILFLYANENSILNQSTFDELIFYSNGIIFKILKINSPNGNTFKDRLLFYISFHDLKELNIFMGFIKIGIINTTNNVKNNLTNYFNIPYSISFYNYYELNNYWVANSSPTIFNSSQTINKYEINFSINNLYAKQIYLYDNLFINVI